MRRISQRGSAMLVTMVLVAALLAGSAILVVLQMTANRATDVTNTGMKSLYCAEAGLAAGRTAMLNGYASWGSALGSSGEPAFLGSAFVNHDLGNGSSDFVLTIHDNDDDYPAANDPTTDKDLRVFLVSTCTEYPDNPKAVEELVQFTGGGQCYQSQLGGCGGNGNNN